MVPKAQKTCKYTYSFKTATYYYIKYAKFTECDITLSMSILNTLKANLYVLAFVSNTRYYIKGLILHVCIRSFVLLVLVHQAITPCEPFCLFIFMTNRAGTSVESFRNTIRRDYIYRSRQQYVYCWFVSNSIPTAVFGATYGIPK